MSLVHAFQFCNHHSNLQTEAMAFRILSLHINKLSNLTLKSKITWVILSTKLRCTDPSRAPSARSSPEGEGRSSPTWMFCPRPNEGGCALEIQHQYLRSLDYQSLLWLRPKGGGFPLQYCCLLSKISLSRAFIILVTNPLLSMKIRKTMSTNTDSDTNQ